MISEKQTPSLPSPEDPPAQSPETRGGLKRRFAEWKVGRAAATAAKKELQRQRNEEATARITAHYQKQTESLKAGLAAKQATDKERTGRPSTPEGMKAFNELLDRFREKDKNGEWAYPQLDSPEAREALWAVRTGALDPILTAEELRAIITGQTTDGVINEEVLSKLVTAEDAIREPAGVPERVVELMQSNRPLPQELWQQGSAEMTRLNALLGEQLQRIEEITERLKSTLDPTAEAKLLEEQAKLQLKYEDTLRELVSAQDATWTNAREGRSDANKPSSL